MFINDTNNLCVNNFIAEIEGNNKHNILNFNIDNNNYITFANNNDNIDAFFISRLFKYINIKTYNSYILYHKKKYYFNRKFIFKKKFFSNRGFFIRSFIIYK